MAVVQAHTFPGATAGDKIRAAVLTLAATGGTVDCTGFSGTQVIGIDICGGLSTQSVVRITFLWGPETYRISVTQTLYSHHNHILNATRFVTADSNGAPITPGPTMWSAKWQGIGGPGSGAAFTDGGSVLTKAAPGAAEWGYLEAGSPISVFGFVPLLGRDETNLSSDVNATVTTIPVSSTSMFPASGYIRIEDEVIFYTGTTGTSFTGCTRGYGGSTAAAHLWPVAPVNRCVYESFIVESVSGSTITIGEGRTFDYSATNIDVRIGPLDIAFTGVGVIDGNKPATDDSGNPYGVQILYGRHCQLGQGITFTNHDHGGSDLEQAQDCEVHSRYVNCGRIVELLGSGLWLFGRCKRIVVTSPCEDCYNGITVDDRSTNPTFNDGADEDCVIRPRELRRCTRGIAFSGGRRNYLEAAVVCDLPSTGIAVLVQTGQWLRNVAGDDNVVIAGVVQGAAGFQAVNVDANYVDPTSGGKRITILSHTKGAPVVVSPPGATTSGAGFYQPRATVVLVYGTTVNTDASRGDYFEIRPTNTTAFTIANPTNGVEDQQLMYSIHNNSGGSLGTITWGSEFRLSGTFTKPTNGNRRTIAFVRRAGIWREIGRTAADQPT